MNMMRMDSNGKNLVCRNCLDRKLSQKETPQTKTIETKKQEAAMKEYFCKECRYNFSRAKHLSVTTCPYCGASGSIMTKGSTARIIADASKMK